MPLISLRDYQHRMTDETRGHFRKGIRRVLIQSPTGSGKTVLAASIIEGAVGKSKRVWWINHRRELLKQSLLSFVGFGIPASIMAAGFANDRNAPVQVCSIDTLKRRHVNMLPPDLIIFDECFPAGTLVDGVPIEDIRVGDRVWSLDTELGGLEKKRVVRTIRKPAPTTMIRFTAAGRTVTCTPNHKIWTNNGWVAAEALTCGTMVACTTLDYKDETAIRPACDMQEMLATKTTESREPLQGLPSEGYTQDASAFRHLQRVSISNDDQRQKSNTLSNGRYYLLLKEMFNATQGAYFERDHGRDEQEVCVGSDEKEQSNALRSYEGKSKDDLAGDGLEAVGSRWEWIWPDGRAITTGIDLGLGDGVCGTDWHSEMDWPGDSLQDRHRQSDLDDRDRSGRSQSRLAQESAAGPEEGKVPLFARVDSFTILKQASGGIPDGVCRDGYVYDLEVEDFHTYTANGIVVSNCHHLGAAGWHKLAAHYGACAQLGLTATPIRLDGTGLGNFFDVMVQGPDVLTLIEQGWLSKYRIFAPPPPDMTGVHTVAGDFNQKEVDERMKTSAVCGNSVALYQKHVPGKQAIAFAWSVESSIELAQRFNAAGIPAAHIDGTTEDKDRDAATIAFASGAIKVLTNHSIVGEGYDLPACAAGFFLRPTQSLTVWLQQVGRVLRPDGDKVAYLFDQVGNACRPGLGLPDDPTREWSLEGEDKKKKKKIDKEPTVRVCPKCDLAWSMQVRVCECGEVLVQSREMDVDEDAQLHELDPVLMRRQRLAEQGNAKELEQLIRVGRARGHQYPAAWARHIIRAREEKAAAKAMRNAHNPPPVSKEAEDQWLF